MRKGHEYVRRGIAVWIAIGAVLEFLPNRVLTTSTREAYQAMQDAEIDDGIRRNRPGGVVWWNGCDLREGAMHLPGENVVYPRPDLGIAR